MGENSRLLIKMYNLNIYTSNISKTYSNIMNNLKIINEKNIEI